jgi:hypothetical protein
MRMESTPAHAVTASAVATMKSTATVIESKAALIKLPTERPRNASPGEIIAWAALGSTPTQKSVLRQLWQLKKEVRERRRRCLESLERSKAYGSLLMQIAEFVEGKGAIPAGLPHDLQLTARLARHSVQTGLVDDAFASELKANIREGQAHLDAERIRIERVASAANLASLNASIKALKRCSSHNGFSATEREQFKRLAGLFADRYRNQRLVHSKTYYAAKGDRRHDEL